MIGCVRVSGGGTHGDEHLIIDSPAFVSLQLERPSRIFLKVREGKRGVADLARWRRCQCIGPVVVLNAEG